MGLIIICMCIINDASLVSLRVININLVRYLFYILYVSSSLMVIKEIYKCPGKSVLRKSCQLVLLRIFLLILHFPKTMNMISTDCHHEHVFFYAILQ